MIKASIKNILYPLEKVLYIYYLFRFQKDLHETKVLIDLGNKINIMTLAYAAKLDLKIQKTNIKARKIDGFILITFEIVLANF